MSEPSLKTAEDVIAFLEGYLISDRDLEAAIAAAKAAAGLTYDLDDAIAAAKEKYLQWDRNLARDIVEKPEQLAMQIQENVGHVKDLTRRGKLADATGWAAATAGAALMWLVRYGVREAKQ